MAIPNNYIDKITKEGDSRPICPAADKVRVDNENFEGADLDAVLDEVAEAIEDAGGGYNPPAGGIPKTDLAQGVQASLNKADLSASQAELATQIDNVITSTNIALQGKANVADVYDKSTVDDMVAEAGKVKTVSVNGGTPAQPDTNGNVNLVVPSMSDIQDAIDEAVNDVVVGQVDAAVIDNFNSTSGTDALSAGKGKDLNERLEGMEDYWNDTNAGLLVTVLQNIAFTSQSEGQAAAQSLITRISTARNVVSISAVLANSSKTWYNGDTFATSDVVVTANYGNGTTKVLTSGYTVSPTALVTGNNTITVTYMTFTTTVSVTALANPITAITGATVKSNANAPAGVDSGTLDTNDYLDAVAVTYANGTTGSITDMNTVVFVSGVTIQDGNNSLQIKLTDYPDVPAYTVTIPSASVDSATVSHAVTDTYSYSREDSITLAFNPNLDVMPNKVVITREATPNAVSTNTNSLCVTSAEIEFTENNGVVTINSISVVYGSNTVTDATASISFTTSGGKVTGCTIGNFTKATKNFAGGYTYTFVFTHES